MVRSYQRLKHPFLPLFCGQFTFTEGLPSSHQAGRVCSLRFSKKQRETLRPQLRRGAVVQTSHVARQLPDSFIGLDPSESRHPAQPDPVLDHPEQFLVGHSLHRGRTQIEHAGIRGLADGPRLAMVLTVTVGAVHSKERFSRTDHQGAALWRRGHRTARCPADVPVFRPGGNCGFHSSGFEKER